MKQTSWSLFRFRDSYFTAYGKKPCKTGISSPYMQQINMIDPLYTANHQVSSVGGFNPFEKYYSSQIGSFPQVGVKIRKYLKPPPSYVLKVKQRNLLARRTSTRTLEYPPPQHLSYPESTVEYQYTWVLQVPTFWDLSKQSFTVDSKTLKTGSFRKKYTNYLLFKPTVARFWQSMVGQWVVK